MSHYFITFCIYLLLYPGNLIGLQLPDENGEVLYLDPNDPAAQMLLQEAGITMGRLNHMI